MLSEFYHSNSMYALLLDRKVCLIKQFFYLSIFAVSPRGRIACPLFGFVECGRPNLSD